MKHVLSILLLLTGINSHTVSAQTIVNGLIKDSEGQPMMFVNILEKGTSNGSISDESGLFSIRCQSTNPILIFSYLGYKTMEVPVNGQSFLNVLMEEDAVTFDDIVVVGTRRFNRSATETPVAVDIIPVAQVMNNLGQVDLNQLLQFTAPSFNSNRQSGADGSDHIDPATLRGLGPDQTLVLINGKRRHQSSLVNIFGTRGRGNTGTDLNTIPAAAIERIEILRDGASAQYGSDAIAGVINIVLKSSVNEFLGNVMSGGHVAKLRDDKKMDGGNYQANGNFGLPVARDGFVNVTVDYQRRNHTKRPADPELYDVYREEFGDAQSDNFTTFINAEVPASEKIKVYAFGGLGFRITEAFAFTRAADSDRNIPEIYPNGFNPIIRTNVSDQSLSAGIKGNLKNWEVDFNHTFGRNKMHYYVNNTLNASLLTQTPTSFDAGGFSFTQQTTGLHFSRLFPKTLSGINVAFGAEHRIDRYTIFAGEEASYKNYGIIDSVIDGIVTPVNVLNRAGGSQGFPGFQPKDETDESRTNIAAYIDAEMDITKKLLIAAAVRAERYSDFGNTINGRLALRYKFSDKFAIRGSAGTGFRAPSLPQIYFSSTFTDFPSGQAVEKIIAPNNSNLTRVLGIPALKQEQSINAALGITTRPFTGFSATVDAYFVDIRDRIVLTGSFDQDDPDIGDLLKALNVGAAQFFTNAVDTRTFGADIILSYFYQRSDHKIQATFAGNINRMDIRNIKTNNKLQGKEDIYFGNREQLFLLASAPPSKLNLTLDYSFKKFNTMIRLVRFAGIELEDFTGEIDQYDPRITTDLSVGYRINDHLQIIAGGSNIFNVYPTMQNTETETGGLWDPVQMGFNGAFFFGRLSVRF